MSHCAHAFARVAALVASTALAACNAPDTLTPPATTSSDVEILGRPTPTSLYTVADLGVPTAYSSSIGTDVNDAGIVVGMLDANSSPRGFIFINGAFQVLSPMTATSFALSISNPNVPFYVSGSIDLYGAGVPARWPVYGGYAQSPQIYPNLGTGSANGVNLFGEAVGWSADAQGGGRVGMYWDVYSIGHSVVPPAGFTSMEGTDINDDGLAVFNARGSATSPDRAYLTDGQDPMIALQPPPDLSTAATYADAISERVGITLYIAGRVQLSGSDVWPARWTIDLGTFQQTVEVRREGSGAALGVSNTGTYVGQQLLHQQQTAYAWLLDGSALVLPLPRATRFPAARSISPNGNYIIGQGDVIVERHALLWTATGP